MKTYTFHISLPGHPASRSIEVEAQQTLEDLHRAIQTAFEFDNDHLYSFFMSGKAWDKKTEYSLPDGVTPYGEFLSNDPRAEQDDLTPEQIIRQEVKAIAQNEEEGEQLYLLFKTMMTTPVKDIPSEIIDHFSKAAGQPIEVIRLQLKMFQKLYQEIIGENERDVRRVKIGDLKLRLRKKFLYLFDYGDEWRFEVRLVSINPKAPNKPYPAVVESLGKPPPQYPNWDEDEEEDEFILDEDEEK